MIALDLHNPPPAPPESRSADYTAQVLDRWQARVTGSVRAGALGGLQVAAGAVGRAFAAAEVEGDDGLLDPLTMEALGWDLVAQGQSIWLLDVGSDGPRLTRSTSSTAVYGGDSPSSWRYTITSPGPSQTQTSSAGSDRVLHARQNTSPDAPWRGRSGLDVAASSGALAMALAGSLAAEGEIPIVRVIPQPFGQSQATADNIRDAVQRGLRLALPETTQAGGGAGRMTSPQTDWKPYRVGGDWDAAGVQLHSLALQETAGVCGLPYALVPGAAAAGPAMREAFPAVPRWDRGPARSHRRA